VSAPTEEQYRQVCKYPDKTKRRKDRLSSKEAASLQVANLWQGGHHDDDKLRDKYQLASSSGRMANWAGGSGQLRATKRSSVVFQDRDGGAKKARADIALPPRISEHLIDFMRRMWSLSNDSNLESHKRICIRNFSQETIQGASQNAHQRYTPECCAWTTTLSLERLRKNSHYR
jgi:hypothetical protein